MSFSIFVEYRILDAQSNQKTIYSLCFNTSITISAKGNGKMRCIEIGQSLFSMYAVHFL